MEVHNKKSLEEIRRALRQKSTKAEDFLWQEIRNKKLNQLKFKRQHSIGNYIVDFYCASKRLVIEVDGKVHPLSDQKKRTNQEMKFLKKWILQFFDFQMKTF